MKKAGRSEDGDMRREYDLDALGPGVRGKHYARLMARSNVVRIASDLAKAFPNERAVNDALRQLLEIAERNAAPRRKRASR
jgi:hypothetical protein